MKINEFWRLALAASVAAAGCDYARRQEYRSERADEVYQEALADYTAGRLDAAQAGFERVVRSDPGNASARFQLAVLLQDARKDYLGAIAAYREFMLLSPDSDKFALAREREAQCATLYVREAAAKLNLGDCAAMAARIEQLCASEKASRAETQRLRKQLEQCEADKRRAEQESAARAALIARLGGASGGEAPARPAGDGASIARAREVASMDATVAARPAGPPAETAASREDAAPKVNPEALAIFAEEERAASTLLPPQTPQNRAATRLVDTVRDLERRNGGEPERDPERPSSYTVETGDTLVKIALRFYGRKSAWKLIREANKATVPVNGAVRAGQTIVLP